MAKKICREKDESKRNCKLCGNYCEFCGGCYMIIEAHYKKCETVKHINKGRKQYREYADNMLRLEVRAIRDGFEANKDLFGYTY